MLLIILGAQPKKRLVLGETGMKASDDHCFLPKFYMLNAEEYSKSKSDFKSRLFCSTTAILFLKCLTIWEQDQELCAQKTLTCEIKEMSFCGKKIICEVLNRIRLNLLNVSWNKTL